MNVEAGIIEAAFKQETSFFNKPEIFAEAEISKGVIDKQ